MDQNSLNGSAFARLDIHELLMLFWTHDVSFINDLTLRKKSIGFLVGNRFSRLNGLNQQHYKTTLAPFPEEPRWKPVNLT